ncbi:MAG TPA: tetratricopeptide repeat protein [Opitutaceae bacterium]
MRSTGTLLLGLAAGLLGPAVVVHAAEMPASLVPADRRVDDVEAELLLARILSYREATWRDSVAVYEKIRQARPRDPLPLLELADVLLRLGERARSAELVREAQALVPAGSPQRRDLARLLVWSGRAEEAVDLIDAEELARWLNERPEDAETVLTLEQASARRDGPGSALAMARTRFAADPQNPARRLALAELEAIAGHAVRSRDLYSPLLATADDSLRLAYARSALSWGDVYVTEQALRQRLERAPDDADARRELGQLLTSFDRFSEAEALYARWLQAEPDNQTARLGLAGLRLKEKRFAEAAELARTLLAEGFAAATSARIQAEALYGAHDDVAATKAYEDMKGDPATRFDACIGLGRIARRADRETTAVAAFAEALRIDPSRPAARYHHAGPDVTSTESFLSTLSTEQAPTLVEWAGLYASDGQFALAVRCLEAALAADPDYFPARLQRAEFLAIEEHYDEAVAAYDELLRDFPGNRQVLLGGARTRAWGRRYADALSWYEQLRALNPTDPLPLREAARTAGWGKERERGAGLYATRWQTSVDSRLAALLGPVLAGVPNTELTGTWQQWLADPTTEEEPFAATARFQRERAALRAVLPADRRAALDRVWLDLLTDFLDQQAFFIENEAKQAAWDQRHRTASAAYERLLALEPGNQEAWFDYGQTLAAQGLGAAERLVFGQLLSLDPNNRLAGRGLFRRQRRSEPTGKVEARWWKEEGRDALSSLRRLQLSASAQLTFHDQAQLTLGILRDRERPLTRTDALTARGVFIEAQAVANRWLSGSAGFKHRHFSDPAIGNADSGQAQAWLALGDVARVGAGYEKREELANEFGLFRGTRSDVAWIGAGGAVNRELGIEARMESLTYSDRNEGWYATVRPSYVWTDHPRIFKTTLALDWRDTDEASRYVRTGGLLTDIIHPYWSPQDYFSGGVTFEWYHDLSQEFFLGGLQHFYAARLTLGTDSEDNAGFGLEAEWRREFADLWILHALLTLQRSRDWDSTGVRFDLTRRF